MKDIIQIFVWALGIVSVVGIIVGGIVYGTITHSQMYYQAQKDCIDAGGSWTPVIIGRSDSYNFQCTRVSK